jgi:hypothetical protein
MESSDDGDKEVEEVKADESGEIADGSEQKAESTEKVESEVPVEVEKKKTGLNMSGIAITVLGVLGLIGGILYDPLMNIVDSSHPAEMSIGIMQMMGIVVAVLVLVAGVMIIITKRKKPSKS